MILHEANMPDGQNAEQPPGGNNKVSQQENPYMKVVQQASEAKLAAQILAGGGGVTDKDHQDGLSVKIIETAMNNTAGLVKQANEMVDRKDKQAEALRSEAAIAQKDLYGLLFSEMSRTGADLRAVIEKIDKDKGSQKDSMTVLKDALGLVTVLKQEFGLGAQPQVVAQPVGESPASIELARMKMDHEKQMKQLEIQVAQMNQDLQFKLLEFNDKKVQKAEELKSNNEFRTTALNTVTDLAAAAAAGFQAKMGGVGSQAGGQGAPAAGGDSGIKAYVSNFPCQSCGERIAVPATGNKATCPSCKIEYDLDRTPGPGAPPPKEPIVPEVPEEEL